MAKNLIIASPAEQDYAEALLWYVEKSQTAAERFEAAFERTLDAILAAPDRFPRCDERHRYCRMRQFPYRVIYRVKEDEIIVIAVAHAKRDPDYWARR